MGSASDDSDLAVQRPPKRTQVKVDAGSDSDLAVQRPPKKESKESKADPGSDSDLAVQRPPKHKGKPANGGSDSDLPVERPSKHRRGKHADAGSDSDLAVERPSKHKKSKHADVDPHADLTVQRPSKQKKKSKQADAGSDSDLAVERPSKHKKSKHVDAQPGALGKSDKARKVKELDHESEGEQLKRQAPPSKPSQRREDDVLPSRMLEPSKSRDPDSGFGFSGKGSDGPKGKGKGKGKDDGNEQPKEQPNFEPSGLLALEDNAKNGIPLKFTVPAEVKLPATKWRLYVFTKANEAPKIIPIHKEVGYLFGKDRRVVEVPTDHPTCSKQHAVLHYRQAKSGLVKPYIMDLESVNGTFVNGKRIEASRYYELKEKDVLKFGMSTREFVLLHGGSANHMAIDAKDLRSPSEG
ncbi:SNIP1 [Symbiodinium natans]|uniref:SNIP1 protein n=1 Tax=Symbiodinium natans TaxID=878477 RepID=A0A812GVH9_9DINO|nr:SNIP1 [Symbiodinium natans]